MTVAAMQLEATFGAARAGTVTTGRGSFRTPCFMPVGTRGAVRLLDSADLDALGFDVVLANTYHLMLRPGAEAVAALGGLHRFTGWDGHILTDSGGFQVFSLQPDVDDDGVTFTSTYDGSRHRFTPESAVATQELLGSDIQMMLDVCPALPAPDATVRLAMDRTLAWAARARAAHTRPGQSLFGIVQGGATPDWRAECAERLVGLDCDGYGIGGLSVGEPREVMLPWGPCRRTDPVTSWASATRSRSSRPSPSASTCLTASSRRAWPATAPPSPRSGDFRSKRPATPPIPARSTRTARARSAPVGAGVTFATSSWSASPRPGDCSPFTTWRGCRPSWPPLAPQ
jgi:hypothetical protein